MQRPLLVICSVLALSGLLPAETIPPKPENYFNDYAGVVSKPAARVLDEKLRQFERDTSNQIVAAIYPKMDSQSSIADYCQRIFDAWKVGQAKPDNGAILFVFVQDRKMRIHTGYGLEGALPDITCRHIIDDEIKPAFQSGSYEAGLTAGLDAMMKAARGEYRGTGKVAADRGRGISPGTIIFLLILGFLILPRLFRRGRGTSYDRRGRHRVGGGWMLFPPMGGGGWSGGGWGSGGDAGGGGGFSGGGGMSGGGGASGDW